MPKGVKGFQKGHKFGVTRKKGVKNKNKKSDQWDYFTNYCIQGGLIRFRKELDKLKGKQYVDAFLTLLEYHKPKLQRSELIGADKMKLQVEWVIPNKQELQERPDTQEIPSGDTPGIKKGIESLGDKENKENKERGEYPPAIIDIEVLDKDTIRPTQEDIDEIDRNSVPPIQLNI